MSSVHVLAAQARRLNREAGAPAIPALFFFTDPERTPNPMAIARRLPRGTAVVYRHFGAVNRGGVARELAAICRMRGLPLLIAADPELAQHMDAGVHWPERLLPEKRDTPGLVTASAHGRSGVARALAFGADACVLSPVLPTRSSALRSPLGLFRASQIARGAGMPVIALGGIDASNAQQLAGRGFAGVAAVDAFLKA